MDDVPGRGSRQSCSGTKRGETNANLPICIQGVGPTTTIECILCIRRDPALPIPIPAILLNSNIAFMYIYFP